VGAGGYDLEEIRRRADLAEIISAHVQLRRAGRRLVGLCPFHQERTPSFTLDSESGLWHCFGCKAGGDLFRFVEMTEKVTFSEAVELLARRLGVAPRRPADAARWRHRDRLLALHEEATKFFQDNLRGEAGVVAAAYLAERGLSAQAIEDFQLGYALATWDSLLRAMSQRGFSEQELTHGGLVLAGRTGVYDRFRDRVIFPIRDAGGRAVAFGGRLLATQPRQGPEHPPGPKYLNSPDTPIFHKGRILYGFDRARRPMADASHAIVVEGYLDAIACHEAGFGETVATMGTALTGDHVEILRRRVERLTLAFDADSAGLAAALRSRDLFQQAGLAVRVATLPEELDPDRIIRDRGRDEFRQRIESALPIVEWQLSRILPTRSGGDEGERMDAMKEAISVLAGIPAGVDREYYVRWLAQRWGAESPARMASLENAIREELARRSARTGSGRRRTSEGVPGSAGRQAPERPAVSRVQTGLLAALVQRGDLAARYGPDLEADDFSTSEQGSILAAIRSLIGRGESVTPQAVLAQLGPDASSALAELTIPEVPQERIEESVASAVRRLLEGRLRRREEALKAELEKVGAGEEQTAILQQLVDCRRRLSELASSRLVGDA
jgi:DNA primase